MTAPDWKDGNRTMPHGVNVIFVCDCGNQANGKDQLQHGFRSFSGRSWGFGVRGPINTIKDITPDGWWAFDPYTNLCYCPECRKSIENHSNQVIEDDAKQVSL